MCARTPRHPARGRRIARGRVVVRENIGTYMIELICQYVKKKRAPGPFLRSWPPSLTLEPLEGNLWIYVPFLASPHDTQSATLEHIHLLCLRDDRCRQPNYLPSKLDRSMGVVEQLVSEVITRL